MKRIVLTALILLPLTLIACSGGTDLPASEAKVGLIGDWKSVDDANYILKLSAETYREFYEAEEVSSDQWQPVKSCDDRQPVEKTAETYGGFEIWTQETDDHICYAISNWTTDEVSLTYAGTTSSYTRID